MSVVRHPTLDRIDHPPSVRCAHCGAWVFGDLYHYGRMPEGGVLFTCECGGNSIASREIVDRLELVDATAIEVASTKADSDESIAGVIARLKDEQTASVTEERWLDAAHLEALTFAAFWQFAKEASAAGQELEDYLAARRRVGADGIITYEEDEG